MDKNRKLKEWFIDKLWSLTGLVIFMSLLGLIFSLGDGWSKVPLEQKIKIETQKSIYWNEVKRCEEVTSNNLINLNDPEFIRCATLLDDLDQEHNNYQSPEEQCSGPYCW